MAKVRNYKEDSRLDWGTIDEKLTLEQINCGAMLRIADATELMAKNYISLQADLEWYKKRSNSIQESYNNLCKSNRSLRGHLTRLKNKLNEKQ